MTHVREVTETDFYNVYNCMCFYFQLESICVFSEFCFFLIVSVLYKQFNAFKANILLLHVFS